MPKLGFDPEHYRRKGDYRPRDMGWPVKLAVPLGIVAPFLAAGVPLLFPPVPWGGAWGQCRPLASLDRLARGSGRNPHQACS